MPVNFQIRSLEYHPFSNLFNLDDTQLANKGAVRKIVDEKPGYPCRVSLKDVEIGEEVILISYQHHKTGSPYQSSGPVYVQKNAQPAKLKMNEIPEMLLHRLLSLRGYDKNGMMIEAQVLEGQYLKERLETIFLNKNISYIHIHNAKPGCFNCVVERI